jgi:hypothetical protein
MLIDCQTCVARDIACHDCVVTVLLSTPAVPARRNTAPAPRSGPSPVELDDDAREAIAHLAGAGLVPPLRLVSPHPAREQDIA